MQSLLLVKFPRTSIPNYSFTAVMERFEKETLKEETHFLQEDKFLSILSAYRGVLTLQGQVVVKYNNSRILYMSIFKVHNLGEGARPTPIGYLSWLDYWEKATGMKANWCHRFDCTQLLAKATDGAHVQLDNPNDNHWYIVPLCHKCNSQFRAHFTVRGPLVSATNPSVILW